MFSYPIPFATTEEERKKFILMICDVYENSTIEILVSMLIILMLVLECANCTPSCHWNVKFGINVLLLVHSDCLQHLW